MEMSDEEKAGCIVADLKVYWDWKMREKEHAVEMETQAWMRYSRATELLATGDTARLIAYAKRIGWDYTGVLEAEDDSECTDESVTADGD